MSRFSDIRFSNFYLYLNMELNGGMEFNLLERTTLEIYKNVLATCLSTNNVSVLCWKYFFITNQTKSFDNMFCGLSRKKFQRWIQYV